MNVLSRTFEKTRILVAFALLLSAGAPLVQYACGVTGEMTTTGTLLAETTDTALAPCGTVSNGVHDRLCGERQSAPVCDGDACTTNTVEKQSVLPSEPSRHQIVSALSPGPLHSERGASSGFLTTSHRASDADWSARAPSSIPVRLRTQSFRL